jgi:hypothetical protein
VEAFTVVLSKRGEQRIGNMAPVAGLAFGHRGTTHAVSRTGARDEELRGGAGDGDQRGDAEEAEDRPSPRKRAW